jgi:flagellar hook-basal body complex protein FliE
MADNNDPIRKLAQQRAQAAGAGNLNFGQRLLGNISDVLSGQQVGATAQAASQRRQQAAAGDLALAEQEAKDAQLRQQADPNSPENVKFREVLQLSLPKVAETLQKTGKFDSLTSGDLRGLLPSLEKQLTRTDEKESKKLDRELELEKITRKGEETRKIEALKQQGAKELKQIDQVRGKLEGLEKETRKLSQTLAKELRNHPTTKETNSIVSSAQRVIKSAEDPSAAGDLALIFNYMKILDPGSVVREGEFANAQNSAGVPDRVRAQYNNLLSGKRLAETQRTDFLSRALKLAEGQLDRQELINDQFRRAAGREGGDPGVVVDDESIEQARNLITQMTPEERDARIQELLEKRGQ